LCTDLIQRRGKNRCPFRSASDPRDPKTFANISFGNRYSFLQEANLFLGFLRRRLQMRFHRRRLQMRFQLLLQCTFLIQLSLCRAKFVPKYVCSYLHSSLSVRDCVFTFGSPHFCFPCLQPLSGSLIVYPCLVSNIIACLQLAINPCSACSYLSCSLLLSARGSVC
jgi:hypothetical protein